MIISTTKIKKKNPNQQRNVQQSNSENYYRPSLKGKRKQWKTRKKGCLKKLMFFFSFIKSPYLWCFIVNSYNYIKLCMNFYCDMFIGFLKN